MNHYCSRYRKNALAGLQNNVLWCIDLSGPSITVDMLAGLVVVLPSLYLSARLFSIQFGHSADQ